MGLSTHEMLLVLRARDEASRVLRGFRDRLRDMDKDSAVRAQKQFDQGSAIATSGVAVAGAGIAGAQAMNNMADAAMAYNEQASSTVTQLDKVGIGMDEVKQIGLDIAKKLPVQFDEIQTSLYDIFSSIDTDGPGARKILEGIGKAAVGGKVDMETAGRGILQIMNAWKYGAGDVTKINDVMFQLVRKGVGTYDQFTKSIGKSIPSAVRAGASFEDLSGMMAFLTRNGLSTAQASTTAARAFDALTNPKTAKNMKKFGISVKDAKGNFRPMVDVVADMRKKLSGMNETARSKALQDMFKGSGGTIQAMRFFNIGVKDNQGQLKKLTDSMYKAKGASKQAYDTMSKTPQAKIQSLKNQYQVMKVELGDKLIPVKLKLAQVLLTLLTRFNNLSDRTKGIIVKFALFATTAAILVGLVAAIAGTFMMFSAAATLAGISLGTVAAISLGVVAGIAAIVAVGYLLYKHWDLVKKKAGEVWGAIKGFIKPLMPGIKAMGAALMHFGRQIWDYLGPIFKGVWSDLKDGLLGAWHAIQPGLKALGDAIRYVFDAINKSKGKSNGLTAIFTMIKFVVLIVIHVIGLLIKILGGALKIILQTLGGILGRLFKAIGALVKLIVAVLTGDWKTAWESAKSLVFNVVMAIWELLKGLGKLVVNIIMNLVRGVISMFRHMWDVLVGHSIIPDMVKAIIKWFLMLPVKLLKLVGQLVMQLIRHFRGMTHAVLEKVRELQMRTVIFFTKMAISISAKVSELVHRVVDFFTALPGRIIRAIVSLPGKLYNAAHSWMSKMVTAVSSGTKQVLDFFKSMPKKILLAIGKTEWKLYYAGRDLIRGLINGVKNMAGKAVDSVKSVGRRVINGAKRIFGIESPSKVFRKIGEYVNLGFIKGITGTESKVTSTMKSLHSKILSAMNPKTISAKQALAAKQQLSKLRRQYKDMVAANYEGGSEVGKRVARTIQKQQRTISDLMGDLYRNRHKKKPDKNTERNILKRIREARIKIREAQEDLDEVNVFKITPRMRENLVKQRQLVNKLKGMRKENREAADQAMRARNAKAIASRYDNMLINIAHKREVIADRLKAAKKKLDDAVKLRDDFAKSVRENYGAMGDIANVMDGNEEADNSAGSLIQKLQTNLKSIKHFQWQLAQLRKQGLSKELYKQLLEAGPEKGMALAESLAKGGPVAIKKVNDLTGQIKDASKSLGAAGANTLYQAGVDSAEGLVRGLKSREGALARAARTLATNMVKAIKRELKIKSPSRVMRVLGSFSGLGLAQGLASEEKTVLSASQRLANAIAGSRTGYNSPYYGHITPAGGSEGKHVSVDMKVYTQEINPVKHAADLGYEIAGRLGM